MQPMMTPRSTRYQQSATTPGGYPQQTPRGARASVAPGFDSILSPDSTSAGVGPVAGAGGKENIHTVVRIRPDLEGHQAGASLNKCVWADGDGKHISIGLDGREVKRFKFDGVFGPEATQSDMFSIAKRFVDAAQRGYNGTIFAYGQTGSGKTYTMLGLPSDLSNPTAQSRGIIPQLVQAIFARISERMATETGVNIDVGVESLEIYNENIRDLLSDKPGTASLDIKNHPQIHVPGLTRISVPSYAAAIRLLEAGSRARTVGATKMNDQSSRSHSVFTLNITTTYAVSNTKSTSRLNLVDLAGSESQKSAGTAGDRLKEAANINKSLSALVGYISYLSTSKNFVAFRNSKLTHLLSDSIGGNSKTTLIATINPSSDVYSDSLNTLNFAATAKEIKSDVKQNVSINGHRVDALTLQKRLDTLAKDHDALKAKNATHDEVLAELKQMNRDLDMQMLVAADRITATAIADENLRAQQAAADELNRASIEEAMLWAEELESHNLELTRRIEDQDHQLSALTSISSSTAQAAAQQVADLQQQLQETETTLRSTQQALETSQTFREDLEQQVATMQEQMDQMKASWAESDAKWRHEASRASQAYQESSALVLSFSAMLRAERAELLALQQRVARGDTFRKEQEAEERARQRAVADQVRDLEEAAAAQPAPEAIFCSEEAPVLDVSEAEIEAQWRAFDAAVEDESSAATMRTFCQGLTMRPTLVSPAQGLTSPVKTLRSPTTPARAAGLYARATPQSLTLSARRSGSEKLWESVTKPVLAQYDPSADLSGMRSPLHVDENGITSPDAAAKHRRNSTSMRSTPIRIGNGNARLSLASMR